MKTEDRNVSEQSSCAFHGRLMERCQKVKGMQRATRELKRAFEDIRITEIRYHQPVRSSLVSKAISEDQRLISRFMASGVRFAGARIYNSIVCNNSCNSYRIFFRDQPRQLITLKADRWHIISVVSTRLAVRRLVTASKVVTHERKSRAPTRAR